MDLRLTIWEDVLLTVETDYGDRKTHKKDLKCIGCGGMKGYFRLVGDHFDMNVHESRITIQN